MAWAGKDPKDHQVPTPPATGRATNLQIWLVLEQAAHVPIQPGLEHLQGWSINLSGQPVPAPHHSLGKELLPDIQSKSSLLELKSISPCPITIYASKKLIPLLFIAPF